MNEQLLITLHCKKKVIIKTRTLVKKAEHTDTFFVAGKCCYCRECYHNGRLKIISILYIILQYWLSVMFHTAIRGFKIFTFLWRNNHKLKCQMKKYLPQTAILSTHLRLIRFQRIYLPYEENHRWNHRDLKGFLQWCHFNFRWLKASRFFFALTIS